MAKCQYINNDILKWARESAGFELSDIKKSFKNIADWEKGTNSPTYLQLEKLSVKYKRPLAVFFFPEIPQEKNIEKSFRTLPEHERNSIPTSVRFALREGLVMQMNLAELYNGKNPSKDNLITKKIKARKNSNLDNLAKEVRKFLGVDISEQKKWLSPKDAFKKWRDILTGKGIFVFKNAFKANDYSGFCLYDESFPIIYINNTSSETRQIFTLFHELAHLLYKGNHLDISSGGIKKKYIDFLGDDEKEIEVFCNKFAAEFLVPKNDLDKEMKNTFGQDTLFSAQELAKIYKVSREVMLRKFLDRKIIGINEYRSHIAKIPKKTTQTKKTGGNYYNTQTSYLGKAYLNLVFGKYLNNKISIKQAAEYLRIKTKSLEKLELLHLGYSK